MDKSDITSIKVPVSMVCVGKSSCPRVDTQTQLTNENALENDQLFPTEILDAGKDYLASSNIEHEVKVFPEVPHGESERLLIV